MEPTKVREKCGSIIRDVNSPAVLQDEAFCEVRRNRDVQHQTLLQAEDAPNRGAGSSVDYPPFK